MRCNSAADETAASDASSDGETAVDNHSVNTPSCANERHCNFFRPSISTIEPPSVRTNSGGGECVLIVRAKTTYVAKLNAKSLECPCFDRHRLECQCFDRHSFDRNRLDLSKNLNRFSSCSFILPKKALASFTAFLSGKVN